MTWHILFLILIWSDLIYWHDYIIFYHFHSNPISIVPCAVSAFTTFLRPSPTSVRQEQPGVFSPPGADRFLIAHGMEKFTEASTFQVGRSKGWYVPQPSHPIEYPGYNHSHIYLGLHPDIECLSGTVTGDTSSGWQAFSRFSLWFSHVSITCLGASESGTAVLDYALLLPSSQ